MPQLNVLPISVSKNVEVMDESATVTRTKSNDDFSKLIDQHLVSSHEETGERLNKTSKSNKKSEAEQLAQKLAEKSAKQVNEIDGNRVNENQNIDNEKLDSAQQKVAANGKNGQESASSATSTSAGTSVNSSVSSAEEQVLLASEQLMSFLYKADNTLLAAQNPLTKQLAAKHAGTEFESLSSELMPEQTPEQKALYEAQLLLKGSNLVADLSGVAKALSTEAVSTEVLEQDLTASIIDKKHLLNTSGTLPAVDKNKDIVKLPVEPIPVKPMLVEQITKDELQTAVITDTAESLVKAENVKAENTDLLSKKQINEQQQKLAEVSSVSPVIKTEKNAENIASNPLEQEIMAKSSAEQNVLVHEKTAKDAASQFESTQAARNKKIAELALPNQAQQGQSKESAALQSVQVSDSQSAASPAVSNQNAIDKVIINQVVTEQQLSKAQGQKVAQALGQEHLSAKADEKISENVIVEDKPIKPVKAEFSANASFTDVSSKATQVAQQSYELQSADILNPAVSTEVSQSQKTNAQLHQETIAIFRKDFADAVKDKVMLMVSQKLQQFDITLDPPELGNMQVRVNLQNEQAVVSFVVQNQQAKEALEQNMHKLRDMLEQQGVDVGDANVEQQSQQSENEGGTAGSNHQQGENAALASDVVEHTLSAHKINAAANAVDYYA